ncbi:GNAT family N-acetyltransferase [Fulvivirga ligni]|uniref:GNAT family N-acetyltransferase n=1 Tax=Fulvivirga ligni TaxID=2904246 RepID=UPI001F440105|nr:GNAT family N-acetyltransferase [Fulvivirga ligni]UII20177.1 N-acetyltransferase family protein [Fulvivirga ligni]
MSKVREARVGDSGAILEILNYEILHSKSIYDYDVKSQHFIELWFEQKRQKRIPILVIEDEGKVIGYGTYDRFRPKEGYKFTVEHSIYIQLDYRGKGYGKILLQKLIDIAREQGYRSMIAGIDASNLDSCRFHEKFGFQEVGRMKDVGFKFDEWLELVFMQLILTT